MLRRSLLVALSILLVAGILAGCADDGEYKGSVFPVVQADSIGSDVVNANSEFAFDIFRALYKADEKGNIFVSPASISTVLAMVMNGAGGTTREEMEEVLRFKGTNTGEINPGFAYLVSLLNREEEGIMLSLANSIWIRENFQVLDSFKKVNTDYFAATIEELDFNKTEAAETMNNWVRETTNGKIDGIVDGNIDPATVMFLINSIYFNGSWKVPFDPENTYETDFYIDGLPAGKVDMMNYKADSLYHDGKGFSIISLPYGEGGVVMDLLLPDEGSSIARFTDEFTQGDYQKAIGELRETKDVRVSIPRFTAEYETSLNKVLKELGMNEIFDEGCDLSGINGRDDLFVSEVRHKTYIDVNEEGTEAAGVTSVEVVLTAIMDPTEFLADRPFMYTIRDTETNSILFMGVFDTPEK